MKVSKPRSDPEERAIKTRDIGANLYLQEGAEITAVHHQNTTFSKTPAHFSVNLAITTNARCHPHHLALFPFPKNSRIPKKCPLSAKKDFFPYIFPPPQKPVFPIFFLDPKSSPGICDRFLVSVTSQNLLMCIKNPQARAWNSRNCG